MFAEYAPHALATLASRCKPVRIEQAGRRVSGLDHSGVGIWKRGRESGVLDHRFAEVRCAALRRERHADGTASAYRAGGHLPDETRPPGRSTPIRRGTP
jgi:hypothetical protein